MWYAKVKRSSTSKRFLTRAYFLVKPLHVTHHSQNFTENESIFIKQALFYKLFYFPTITWELDYTRNVSDLWSVFLNAEGKDHDEYNMV